MHLPLRALSLIFCTFVGIQNIIDSPESDLPNMAVSAVNNSMMFSEHINWKSQMYVFSCLFERPDNVAPLELLLEIRKNKNINQEK